MKVDRVLLCETTDHLYIVRGDEIYRTNAAPYRKIAESELEAVNTPLPVNMYIQAAHLFEPETESFQHDLKVYGLEIEG